MTHSAIASTGIVHRTRWLAWLLGMALAVVIASVRAAGLPLIVSATVNYTQKTLTINGQNLGGSPNITLDSMTFPTKSSASNQIVADFPNGSPPSSFMPGTYFLTVVFKNQLPTVFAVDIGANGPQGPAGPIGAQGATGPAGPMGPVGPTGPAGSAGPMGIAGPIGPPGPAGPIGSQGPAGPQGPTGSAGPQGPAGTGTGTTNLGALNGLSCTVGPQAGSLSTSVSASTGTVSFSCAPAAAGTSFPVGRHPVGIAFDGTDLWVANRDDNTVTEIRPTDGATIGTFAVGTSPVAIVFDGATGIWIASSDAQSVTELRISDGALLRTVPLPVDGHSAMVSDGTRVWVSSPASNSLTQLDRASGTPTTFNYFSLNNAEPLDLLFDGTNIWFGSPEDGTVREISPADGSVLATVAVQEPRGPQGSNLPAHMAFDGTYIWLCAAGDTVLTAFKASDGSPAPFQTGTTGPVFDLPVGCTLDSAVYFDGTSIWVGGPVQGATTLPAYDLSSVRASDGTGFTQTLVGEPGGLITGIVSDGLHLWLTDASSNRIIKQ
jgi:hypothetical protein